MTVFFEDPFYVAVLERQTKAGLQVARIVFGAEPKAYDIYEMVLRKWPNIAFSAAVKEERALTSKATVNPKRAQRDVANLLGKTGVGTKAQQALALQNEQQKTARKQRKKERKQERAQRQFLQRQAKKKQKKKGR